MEIDPVFEAPTEQQSTEKEFLRNSSLQIIPVSLFDYKDIRNKFYCRFKDEWLQCQVKDALIIFS